MKAIKFFVILFLSISTGFAQSLFIPLEFQDAYEEGTRSLDGKPGPDYWQNHSDYKLSVTLDPVNSEIIGSGTITYYNASPDTLDRLVLRLYQNLFKPGTMKDFQLDEKDFTEGMKIRSLSVNKRTYSLSGVDSVEDNGTNLILKDLKILPGKQAIINVTWDFKIPRSKPVRMGQYDSTRFFIAYWYPQVAVYDDIDGWDMNEYTGQTEFYNDFNNYDVRITVPSNFGVWATGTLQNPSEVLAPNTLAKYNEAGLSAKVVNIISPQDLSAETSPYNHINKENVWYFTASGVPDFTFGSAANYLWDGRAAQSAPGKKVFVNAAYLETSLDFYEVCEVASKTIEMLSKDIPGIPFPYSGFTVFNGRGGMESPMMVNMGSNSERIWMVHTTVHETVHSYFPFAMGINERKYAWMDEGFAQMISEYIQFELDKTIDFRARNVKRYLDYAGQFDEVPMMYPSFLIRSDAYGGHAYFRPANALNILKDFMGELLFKKALQDYMNRWQGKHPTPYDFFFSFEDAADDEYAWFYQPWFFNQGYPDLAIDSVTVKDDNLRMQIVKEGALPVPVALTVKFKDGSVKRAYRSAAVWKSDDEDNIWIEMEIDKKPASIELGSQYIPDVDTTNNLWLFK